MFKHYSMILIRGLLILSVVALSFSGTCSKGTIEQTPTPEPINKIKILKKLNIEVAYEPEAEPFVTASLGGGKLFSILRNNITALYEPFDGLEIKIPESLDEMLSIPDQGKSSYTEEDVVIIVNEYREKPPVSEDGSTINIFVLFLNGFHQKDGEEKKDSGGISRNDIYAVAIFKPAILTTKSGETNVVPEFVEQSTLVHEIGHLAGLVNNGISAASDHEDKEHAYHCANPDCVMQWKNEGLKDLLKFMTRVENGDKPIFFCSQCLEDMKKYVESKKAEAKNSK